MEGVLSPASRAESCRWWRCRDCSFSAGYCHSCFAPPRWLLRSCHAASRCGAGQCPPGVAGAAAGAAAGSAASSGGSSPPRPVQLLPTVVIHSSTGTRRCVSTAVAVPACSATAGWRAWPDTGGPRPAGSSAHGAGAACDGTVVRRSGCCRHSTAAAAGCGAAPETTGPYRRPWHTRLCHCCVEPHFWCLVSERWCWRWRWRWCWCRRREWAKATATIVWMASWAAAVGTASIRTGYCHRPAATSAGTHLCHLPAHSVHVMATLIDCVCPVACCA